MWIAVPGLPTAPSRLPVWQLAHCAETAKLAWNRPSAQLEKLPLWQLSQMALAAAATVLVGMWFAGLPWAGGRLPVWQLAHCAATAVWVWFQLLGLKLVVEWQRKQLVDPTGTWLAGLPLALLPLWQMAQLVAALKPL